MSDTPKDQDELTEEEAAKRRDEVLKRMLKNALNNILRKNVIFLKILLRAFLGG